MAAQVLSVELSNLIQESKRKNPELKQAAEKSLNELKSIGQRPEAQIAEGSTLDNFPPQWYIKLISSSELSSRPGFLSPFLIACGTRNAKFCTIAVICLQRLIVSRALAKSRLKEVLEAFREASHLGVEIQLKILQALPAFLQNYADGLQGKLLGETLLLCSVLQGSKTGVVNNTAAATLQQLVISTFDKVVIEDDKGSEIPPTDEAPSSNGTILVRPAAFDAYRIFLDICLLTEGLRPQFLRFNSLPQTFGLELIESVLTNHSEVFLTHPEQTHILRRRLVPLVIKYLGERHNFPTMVRITRVLYTLLRKHLSILSIECETALGLLVHVLDPDAAPQWKRALCMEVFRGICAEPALIRKIYAEYDAKESKKPIMKEMVAALTRLATEKPSVIGLGSQSTAPAGQTLHKDISSEQAALEAGGVAGIIGGAVGLGEVTVPGLSAQWSIIRVPCIDQLDKTEPPSIPESYIYHLTLTCINSFSEGLAKFILPLSVSSESSKGFKKRPSRLISGSAPKAPNEGDGNSSESPARTPSPSIKALDRRPSVRRLHLPINPLTLDTHPLYNEIVISAGIVETCWPALLASCSTFLYAALDSELYHALVRSFQKFTHVAGLLRLSTPRDAFLTTLGKAAVPSNVLSANIPPLPPLSESSTQNTSTEKSISTADSITATLNTRNLLCLRALLNLGIALGSTLEASWSIILETFQQADYVIYAMSRKLGRQGSVGPSSKMESVKGSESNNLMSNISQELAAVEAAATKMFESTKDFPDAAFLWVLSSLCKLLEVETGVEVELGQTHALQSATRIHKRTSSFSSARISSQMNENVFAIAKLGEIAQINMHRLIASNPKSNGWDMLVRQLIAVASSRDLSNAIRIKSAGTLNDITISAAKAVITDSKDSPADVQKRILLALRNEATEFGGPKRSRNVDSSTKATELDIHRAGLETLNSILEQLGQSLVAGWDIVFDIITSIFDTASNSKVGFVLEPIAEGEPAVLAKSPKLIRSAFSPLQLICSDFLSTLPIPCILVLVDALYAFCSQKEDLNISLTTITFFWNVSDFLQTKGGSAHSFTPEAKDEQELMRILRRDNLANSSADLWMFLLLRLTAISRDSRSEVRNGSIQTLFRIFDTYGPRLSAQTWRSCLEIVVFKMMDNKDAEGAEAGQSVSERKLWDDTINLVLKGIGTLYSNYFEVFSQQVDFHSTWTTFIQYLEYLLKRRSVEISTTVFKVLGTVLDKATGPHALDSWCLGEAWRMWSSQTMNFADNAAGSLSTSIQDTLTAFVGAFSPLYRLLKPTLDAKTVEKALAILQNCILYPDQPQYFRDTENLTPLQTSVLFTIQSIRTDIPDVPTLLLKQLSFLSALTYTNDKSPQQRNSKQQRPSYIALSLASTKQIEAICLKHVHNMEIYTSGALADALHSLKLPISLKYDLSSNASKRSGLWKQSTNTILVMLRQVLPAMAQLAVADNFQGPIWEQIAAIVSCVVYADCARANDVSIIPDEQFDIQAFRELRSLIIPCLGNSLVPQTALKHYISNVYKASLLYSLEFDACQEEPEWNLELVSKERPGNTNQLSLQKRAKMAYVCLDELFELLNVKDADSDEVIRLACVASPYLILRIALVLRIFISDQPLRGRMPQPICQRNELLYILKRLVDLTSNSLTFLSRSARNLPVGISITNKPHLLQLSPFLSQAIAVSQGDQELLLWLSKTFGELGKA